MKPPKRKQQHTPRLLELARALTDRLIAQPELQRGVDGMLHHQKLQLTEELFAMIEARKVETACD